MANEFVNKPKKGEGLLRAAWWIAVIIFLSKVAGFLRDIVVANYYGASIVSDAYFFAYQIPALVIVILGGVGGPFHSATVAVFSKLVKDFSKKPYSVINNLFNTLKTFSILIFLFLSLLCFFFPRQIMSVIINNPDTPELLNLAAYHLKIMSPMLVMGSVLGLYYGILVTYKHFLLPNISPSMVSFGIIIVLLVAKGDCNGFYLALGTTIGCFMQLIVQSPAVRHLGYGFKPSFDFLKNKNFNELLELLFPAFLSSTIGQLGVYVDMFFSSGLREGAWTAFGFANRIFQFPVGLLLSAILVPLFPLFSRLVAQKDYDGVRHYFTKGVGSLIFVGSYLMILIFIIRTDAIRIALERGAFNSEATLMVSEILFFISISIIPYVFRDSATRLFYSFNDSKTPFYIAIACIALKVVLNSILVKPFGINGIAISTTLITAFNGIALAFLLRKKISIGYRKLFRTVIKILTASAIAFVIGDTFSILWDRVIKYTLISEITKIILVMFLTFFIYLIASFILKIEYLKDLKDRIAAKWKKA